MIIVWKEVREKWGKWSAVSETHEWPHCFLTLSCLLTKSSCTFPQLVAALGSGCGFMVSNARTDLISVTLSWFWPGQSSFSHSCIEGSGAWSHLCGVQVYYSVPCTSSLGASSLEAVALGGRKMDTTQNRSHFVPFSEVAKWRTEPVGWCGLGEEWLV